MKRLLCVALAFLLACGLLPASASGKVYIATAEQLFALSSRVAAGDSMAGTDVYLTTDIVLSSPFTPIGTGAEAPFSGRFHGGGHIISGLEIKGGDYAGLFGYVYCGSIDNLIIENAKVSGENYAAIIVGRLYSYETETAVVGCKASGAVAGKSYVGGVAGYACAAAFGEYAKIEIEGCSFSGNVKGDLHVGGIAGKAEARSTSSRAEALIKNCTAYGTVSAAGRYASLAGGVCGSLEAGSNGGSTLAKTENCVSYAEVSAEITAAGGVCGAVGAEGFGATALAEGNVAFGGVYSAALAGGLAGKCEAKDRAVAEIKNSIAAGNILGGSINAFSAGKGVSGCQSAAEGMPSYSSGVTPPVYTKGDANGDGVCDNVDAALVLKYDAGLIILGAAALSACDINDSGGCDNLDAAHILRIDAGL